MDKAELPTIDDYQFNISCIGSYLFIEAEELASKRNFSLKLDSDSVIHITNGLFTDIQTMCQGMIDAIKKTYPGMKVSVNPGGKIVYSANISLGAIKKEYEFSIDLEENKLEPVAFLERKVTLLSEENHYLKMEIEKIKIENDKKFIDLNQRLQRLEEKLSQRVNGVEKEHNLPVKPEEKKEVSDVCFNASSRNSSFYSLSEGDRTVRLVGNQGKHPCIECLPQVPSQGQHKYSLLLNLKGSDGVAFGITTRTNVENFNHEEGSFWYWTKDGKIRSGASAHKPLSRGPMISNNTVVSMLVDMSLGNLAFMQNNAVLCSCPIPVGKTYFVYVSLGNVGDSVSLV